MTNSLIWLRFLRYMYQYIRHIEPQCAKQEHVKRQLRFEAHKMFLNAKVLVVYNARNPSFHAVRTAASTLNIFESVIDR